MSARSSSAMAPMIWKHQPTRGRAQIAVVPETAERNSAGLEFGQGVDQVTKRAAEPVQLPDQNRIELPHYNTPPVLTGMSGQRHLQPLDGLDDGLLRRGVFVELLPELVSGFGTPQ
jgi:hypothetical protein